MQDDNNKLPEGTDKIINGASSTTTGTGASSTAGGFGSTNPRADTDVLLADIDRGPSSGTTPRTDITTAAATGQTGKSAVIDKIRSGGEKLSGQAADKARGLVGQGLERGAEALANVGKLVGDTADGIDERLGAEYGDYARRAATAIDDAANSLAGKDADELIDDTRKFVRKSPGVALAGAAVVGFALARLIKAGLASGDNDDEDGKSGNGGNSREA